MRMDDLEQKIEQGISLSVEEVTYIAEHLTSDELYEMAHKVTIKFASRQFDLCSIVNVKSGHCSEDCKWCAQSGHYPTDTEIYGLVDLETILNQARHNEEKGIARISLVASGCGPARKDLDALCKHINSLQANCGMKVCASLGLASESQLKQLQEAGVTRYHCNLETAPSMFGKLCTTHTQQQKINTLLTAKRLGMDICSGGIIGMGETEAQRIELAFKLRELEVQSIPINLLHPVPNTPLENTPLLKEEELVRTVALFRLIHPTVYLRLAGGRARLSADALNKALYVGANAAIVGDLLTTVGSNIDEDKQRFKEAGYVL